MNGKQSKGSSLAPVIVPHGYFHLFSFIKCFKVSIVLSVIKQLNPKSTADDTLVFYFYLSKEIRLDVSCESSA